MDPATIKQLVADHPEGYRGGKIDAGRPIGQATTLVEAWENAERCLEDENGPRAAYWAGLANAGDDDV